MVESVEAGQAVVVPKMAEAVEAGQGVVVSKMLGAFKFNVSHQEVERILGEVEAWWESTYEQVGLEWLPLDGIVNFLCHDLGYEDLDEFEDAMAGSFTEFLNAFPHIEIKKGVEGPEGQTARDTFKVTPQVPGPPRRMTLRITDSKQLVDITFFKHRDAHIRIPSIEFEVGADQKRHIDCLFNHLSQARDNIENHAKMLGSDPEQAAMILETVETLTEMLDAPEPYEIIIDDPLGLSEFFPMDGVIVEPM